MLQSPAFVGETISSQELIASQLLAVVHVHYNGVLELSYIFLHQANLSAAKVTVDGIS